MTAKAPKTAKTDAEDLLAELSELGSGVQPTNKPPTSKHKSKKSTGPSQEEQDLLAELDKLDTLAQARPISRPQTPRGGFATTSAGQSSGEIANRTTEDKVSSTLRKSQESSRSFHQSSTPTELTSENAVAPHVAAASEKKAESSNGSSWWGGLVATASAAVTQAQAMAKELQQHEEAQKWADQVKGNVGALRSYGKISVNTIYTF